MRFTKFGKALAMCALSAGIVFGVASCVESYSVGFLYVVGTVTAQSGNDGIISGFKIDHNTGRLATINTLPVSSGGANPVRAVLTLGSRFLYVLNRGANNSGNGDCLGTVATACANSNIQEFAVGGNGTLTPQETFDTQGVNPFRMITDTSGNYLLVLDHDAPDSASYTGATLPLATPNSCMLALGNSTTSCADVTVFKINQTTGRLSLVENEQVTAASGQQLTYFPIPANPIDFVLSGGFLLALTGAPAPSSFPYVGGTEVWPYNYVSTSGQLTLSQNSVQPLGIDAGTAIVVAGGVIYVLDNSPLSIVFNGTATSAQGQIIPFSIGGGGALQAEPSGIIPDDPVEPLSNPIQVLLESKGKFLYVANQGNNVAGTSSGSGIAGYDLPGGSAGYTVQFIEDEPFGSGAGPQCIVEDPSDQYIYEANEYDSTVTGRVLNPSTGDLSPLRATGTYTLQGPPTWCLIDGRTG
jgi:hypothetical protein